MQAGAGRLCCLWLWDCSADEGVAPDDADLGGRVVGRARYGMTDPSTEIKDHQCPTRCRVLTLFKSQTTFGSWTNPDP